MNTAVFIQEMLVLYSIALLGFIMRRIGVMNEHATTVITQLLLNITLPALILYTLDASFSMDIVIDFLWLVSMSVYVLTISIFLAMWLSRHKDLLIPQKSVFEGLIIFGNQGFIGYAISYIVLGEQGVFYLTLYNVYYLILIWTYGIFLFSKNKGFINWKNIIFNPGIISTLIGLGILLLPISWSITISSALELVGKMTIPLSMMMIGMLIANIELKEVTAQLKNIQLWKIVLLRLLIIPALLLPFSLVDVPSSLLLIAVLVSGMPSAPTIFLYAKQYGGDLHFATLGVLLTTLLCTLTIPLLYTTVYIIGK
ncbi:AEC family transporter [Bacillus marasmi]|uniref:AEC family transporter n=1 Tax=Bacillus marasmi TaxID=1926279 RepID=UPI0011C8AD0D|nr:AEC family transporter [Bacillus marasmi]